MTFTQVPADSSKRDEFINNLLQIVCVNLELDLLSAHAPEGLLTVRVRLDVTPAEPTRSDEPGVTESAPLLA